MPALFSPWHAEPERILDFFQAHLPEFFECGKARVLRETSLHSGEEPGLPFTGKRRSTWVSRVIISRCAVVLLFEVIEVGLRSGGIEVYWGPRLRKHHVLSDGGSR